MTPKKPLGLKRIWLWVIIIACSLVAAILGFFSAVSIWIGFSHTDQNGFWVPILAGTLCFVLVFWLLNQIATRILGEMEEDDVVNI
jgi:uncharacterized membrane protein HdeD (DUF308 family)